MTAALGEKISRAERTFPLLTEYGIYLFVLLMFAGKFGTLREIGLYLPASLWLLRGILTKEFSLEWREPLFVALVALVLSAVMSSLLSSSPWQSFHFLKKEYLKVLLLYIVISATFFSPEALKRLAMFLAFTGVVYLIIGYSRIVADLTGTGSIQYEETRYYATVFLYFLPFVLLRTLDRDRLKRALWAIPLLAILAGILVIGVRGSWLGVLGIACVWFSFLRGKTWNVTAALKVAVPALAALILVVFFLFPGQYRLMKEHTLQKVQMSLRAETWNTFLMMSRERWFAGHGLWDGAMTEHYREYYKGLKGTYPQEGYSPTTPHNQFLKILYQQGVTGLLLYAAVLVILFARMVRTFLRNRDRDYAYVGIAVIATVLGEYVIRCLTEDRSLVPLSVLLGMAGAYLNATRVRGGRTEG